MFLQRVSRFSHSKEICELNFARLMIRVTRTFISLHFNAIIFRVVIRRIFSFFNEKKRKKKENIEVT